MVKRVWLTLICVWGAWCAQAQTTYPKVMVGDSITPISLGFRLHTGLDIPHVGPLRRGHASIDWTLRGALTVPSHFVDVDGTPYPLEAVGFHAFYKCVGLTKVTLPPTVRLLCYEAFYGCSALTEVHLPESLVVVGERSFCGCSSLRRITLPCTVPPRCPADVFDATTYQEAQLVVPKGCREAYQTTEPWCSFTQIEEGEPVTAPTAEADYGYWQRAKEALETAYADEQWRIPQRMEGEATWTVVVATGRGPQPVVFSTLRRFDMAVVGSGVAGECCIDTTFVGTLSLPDSVSAPDGHRYVVGGVSKNAFAGCGRLQEVVLPRHLTFIDKYAFFECRSLRRVVIPEEVRLIQSSVFVGCNSLKRVEVLSPLPPDLFVDAFDDRTFGRATLVLPEGCTDAYMATDAWPLFRYHMEAIGER